MDNETKPALSKEEQTAANAAGWLVSVFLLVGALYNLLLNNTKILHVGFGWIIGGFAAMVVFVGLMAAYVVLFVKRLVHIKAYKGRYTTMIVLLAVITGCTVYFGANYTADLFGGSHEIVTNEYKIYDDKEFHFIDGEKKPMFTFRMT